VLVTAGASGIGRVIAEAFLAEGSQVHVCDIDEAKVAEFNRLYDDGSACVADVSNPDQVEAMFSEIKDRYGRLDVLVNNAGIAGPTARLEDIDPDNWNRTIAIDLSGVFLCARQAVPLLKEVNGGSIINISSSAAFHGYPLRSPYVASKWGVIGLTKTWAMELGEFGIRVNALCPGSVEGERIDRVIAADAKERGVSIDEIRKIYTRQTSMGTFVRAEDVAGFAVFLASDAANRISGQAIGVDGHTEGLSSL
jgi:NAD(P)-dependent dehydrogenase (short-subunit alcohol dehydrogenase family)